jgi:hypothetical protein
MLRLNDESPDDQDLLPRDVFNMIGGSGSGGWVMNLLGAPDSCTQYRRRFIAILLVVLGLSAEQALDEFIKLSVDFLEKQGMEPTARTAALEVYIYELLESHGMASGMRLWDPNVRSKGSKMCVFTYYFN